MIDFISKYRILCLCALGSIIRLLYGFLYEPWLQAPDQMAWELVLDQRCFRYDHLIHYPHEGGTILMSLGSQIIKLFTNFSSLTILAFILDFAIRFIQITIVKQCFSINIATWFGLWTVFATPTLLPWGTVNFGLHAVASVFPFIIIWLLTQDKKTIKTYFIHGMLLGLTVWFSYSNLVLVPIFFLFLILKPLNFKNSVVSGLGFLAVIMLHVGVRYFFDPGFHLNELGLMSIRGVDFSIQDIGILNRLYHLPSIIANSALALPDGINFMFELRWLYYLILVAAIFGWTIQLKRGLFDKITYIVPLIILLFLMIYLISPFFETREAGSYILFRHLTYILPLMALFIILGLKALKFKIALLTFLSLGLFQSSQMFFTKKVDQQQEITKAAGWIMGTKLGHDISAITAIVDDKPEQGKLLKQGIGWGIASAILYEGKAFSRQKADEKVDELLALISQYPDSYQSDLLEGVKFSFGEQLTPRLNPDLLIKIKNKINM